MNDIFGRVEALALNGTFGAGKFVKVVKSAGENAAPQFASQLDFLVVELDVDSARVRVPVVVKTQPKTAAERVLQNSDYQFRAEVSVYSKILPAFGGEGIEIAPEFFYGEGTFGADAERDVVILRDMGDLGFKTAPDLYLSPGEVKIALRRLGEFHGMSYRLKKTRRLDFDELTKGVPMKPMTEDLDGFMIGCFERGFNAVKESARPFNEILTLLKKYGAPMVSNKLCLPQEPFSVIVHGDFNRNNLLYKYSVDGEAESVKFLDFQNTLYGDPSMDISFFLYMNTTQRTRDNHWDDFLRVYWEGVQAIEPDPDFTFRDFVEHFRTKAIYGYFPCCFFLPMMLDPLTIPIDEFLELGEEARVQRMITAGGDQGTDAIADIVKDLLNRGYLDGFMQWADLHLV